MKKYIFLIGIGEGKQSAAYFSKFTEDGTGITTCTNSYGARILYGVEEARQVSREIEDRCPSFSVIWCEIATKNVTLLEDGKAIAKEFDYLV